MFKKALVFDLSFAAPKRRPRTKPQLIFTMRAAYLPELIGVLQIIGQRYSFKSYLGRDAAFVLPVPDLFGNTEFGYGKCGFVECADDEVRFRLELSEAMLSCTAATIHVLTTAFSLLEERPANRFQQVEISTSCKRELGGYGHGMFGFVSTEFRQWLLDRTAGVSEKQWSIEAPPEVAAAMRQAWSAVVSKVQQSEAKRCRAYIAHGGRFSLECPGDACDIAIYPDLAEDGARAARFGCHNLDVASQQITLLAGLAKMCELAREKH